MAKWQWFLNSILFFIGVFCFGRVNTFPPQPIPSEYETRTVKDITKTAFYQATLQFLLDYNLVNNTGQGFFQIIKDFFGPGRLYIFPFVIQVFYAIVKEKRFKDSLCSYLLSNHY